MLNGKKILLCVTGGIAVYKAATITSKLTQAGADVKVMLTNSATKFVPPLTFQALSRNEVYVDTFIENNPKVIAHIDVADWADLVVVAPATANMIGKLANGIADDMISTTLLATKAPVWIAPAMNVHMYEHPAVRKNMETIVSYDYQLIEPNEGYLACGYVGKGRLEEPETIVARIENYFVEKRQDFAGKTIIVTAGPTRERLDPVRFLTNFSTGKMGYAIAEEAHKLGANVILISGPTQLKQPDGVTFIPVESAQQMYEAVLTHFDKAHVVIKTAAVADYRPKHVHKQKMKKNPGDVFLELERTNDILFELGQRKTDQLLIGFAAETERIEENAIKKLESKNADMIIANNITEAGAGFASDTNIVTIYKRDGKKVQLPMLSKHDVAQQLLKEIKLQLKDEQE